MGTTDSGLDLETKIFSTSGRGKTFFLTSLFIELIDPDWVALLRSNDSASKRSYLRFRLGLFAAAR